LAATLEANGGFRGWDGGPAQRGKIRLLRATTRARRTPYKLRFNAIQLRIAFAPLFGGGPHGVSGLAQHPFSRRGDAGASKKRGFWRPNSRTTLAKVKSWKSAAVASPSSTIS